MTETPYDAPRPGPPGPDAPSEDEMRELMLQLRAAPAADLLADLFSSMLSTAQVKLGRRDARLFIDLCAQSLDQARLHLPDELAQQVDAALGQLRLAQVTAEGEIAKAGQPEPNDLDHTPAPPSATAGPTSAASAPPPPASRLWVPGQ